jgi:Tol biopolymer transport system component/predicted Ser/Thr protein kinase
MPLSVGTKLGPYEILAPLGAGGMGEVYKARDTRLGRTVAIKVAGEQFSERFEREAHAIAALNHSHICQLYDVGPNYLVMEYIEGAPLKGPVPLDQALHYAAQICDALDAAHRKGITHRDLKPANILVTKTGIKLLDFGLAKLESEGRSEESPTLTLLVTQQGAVMGTPAYMAPEQWEGKTADARTDVYAFGCVFYELLTGERALGPTAKITTGQTSGTGANPMAMAGQPSGIQSIIRTCLAQDPDDRWQSVRDIRRALDLPATNSPVAFSVARPRTAWLGWIAAGIFGVGAASLAFEHFREKASEAPFVRFTIPPPVKMGYGLPTVSPDGSRIVFQAGDTQGKSSLWIRDLSSPVPKALPGTEGAEFPFWAPDGRHLAFGTAHELKKIGVDDGIVEVLCETPLQIQGGAWGSDGNILVSLNLNGIYIVSAAGGALTRLTLLDGAHKETRHYWPSILPDGKHVVFLVTSSLPEVQGVWIASLNNPADRRRILPDLSQAQYSQGHLLFVRNGNLAAQPFDINSLKMTGEPVPILDQVSYNATAGFADFSVSANGVLALGAREQPMRLVTFDRTGKALGSFGAGARTYQFVTISPDQTRVAADAPDAKGYQIFVFDPARDATAQITVGSNTGNFPVWSPDGGRIAFGSNRDGVYNIYIKASSGASQDEVVVKNDRNKFVLDWSKDGRYLLYGENSSSTTRKEDLWILPMFGGGAPSPYIEDEFDKRDAKFSPDSRWVAYSATETPRREVFVRSFPSGAKKLQISTDGGSRPRWRDDGKELFYMDVSGRLMAIEMRVDGDKLSAGVPKPLFESGLVNSLMTFDVYRGGQRFVMGGRSQAQEQPISVILNWTGLLNKATGQR